MNFSERLEKQAGESNSLLCGYRSARDRTQTLVGECFHLIDATAGACLQGKLAL